MAELKEEIRQRVKSVPHLIVIDNVEASSLTKNLLRLIQDWGDPSRFIVVSRLRPDHASTVFSYSLPELNLNDAQSLMQRQAQLSNVPELIDLNRTTAEKIFAVTGGNPLALKLVVGLADTLPLPHILADLERGHFPQVEAMYSHIYREAWRNLSPTVQAILQTMPLVSDAGALPGQIAAMSGIEDEGVLLDGIFELVNRSLLEVGGALNERRYNIHRLTASFLQTEINNWRS